MTQEQLNLNWDTYSDHLKEIMQTLMETNRSADVTLVCEDKAKFKAHKFVLTACSPVFQSIIDDLPWKEESVIYLKGVPALEMQSILQFMYLGQTSFFQDRVTEFLNVARSLEIKEIGKVDFDEGVNVKNENVKYFQSCSGSEENLSNFTEKSKKTETSITSYRNESGLYQCDKCEKQFSVRRNMYRHIRSTHEGINYPCNICNQLFTSKFNVDRHIKTYHEKSNSSQSDILVQI